jgi:hypothetical protein
MVQKEASPIRRKSMRHTGTDLEDNPGPEEYGEEGVKFGGNNISRRISVKDDGMTSRSDEVYAQRPFRNIH